MREIDKFYLEQEEPIKSTFLALRDYILTIDPFLTEEWKYKLPFFCYKGKMFCYLWKDKKKNEPYIGVVDGFKLEHPLLEKGDRSRMKIIRANPNEDLPVEAIPQIRRSRIDLRKDINSSTAY